MLSKINILLAIILSITFSPNPAISTEQQSKQDDSGIQNIKKWYPDLTPMLANVDEAIQDENDVRSVASTGNLKNLQNLADNLEKKWFEKDKKYYWYIMSVICDQLSSYGYNEGIPSKIASRYAKQTIEKSKELSEGEKIPMHIEFNFLMNIKVDYGSYKNMNELSQTNDWKNKRAETAKYYFQGWERLEKSIDPNYGKPDPNYRPGPIRPPKGVDSSFSGMSPKAIKDPNLRAQYEKTLQEDHEKKRRGLEQFQLMRTKKESLPLIQSNILYLYSGPLYESKTLDINALNTDLVKYIRDLKLREIILEAMKNKLSEELKPKQILQIKGIPLTSIKTGSIYKDAKSDVNNSQ